MTEPMVPAQATGSGPLRLGDATVIVEDVHVRYVVDSDHRRTLREVLASAGRARRHSEVHALKGVSFTAHAGEVIGVIGSNGSGKSSLMRVIAGLQPVASGTVQVRSTPMLLGVGAVLNKTLSGRRNILLGGLALGLSKAEIMAREEAIIEFAGIRRAIDLPMRTYSSGMSARLQFAVSAAVEPDILIVDEALSVGDQSFRQKSSQRIRELRAAAGTVFLVSHSMGTLRETCTRVLWLEDGVLKADGPPGEVIREYRAPLRRERRRQKRRKQRRRAQARRRRQQQAAQGGGQGPNKGGGQGPKRPGGQGPNRPSGQGPNKGANQGGKPPDQPAAVGPRIEDAGP